MRGPEARMNTPINFVEHLNGFSAQGQEFFIRRQGHGSILRATILPSTTAAARRGDHIGIGVAPAIRSGGANALTS